MDDTKREWVRSWLIPYATAFRYPNTLGVQFPSVAEVTTAIEHAQTLYDFVLQKIPEDAHPGANHTATP